MRSGLTEGRLEAMVAANDDNGRVLFSDGDITDPIFYRSSIKPLQATVSLEAGADLPPEHLAVACSSHSGFPVHVAIVSAVLRRHGLDREALQTPPDRPLDPAADRFYASRGDTARRRVFHNCSGNHAGFLAACVATGWPVDTYTRADHPLQERVIELVADATSTTPFPLGIDGCGVPTMRGNVRGLATAFARISSDPRFAAVADATHRYPSLVADSQRPDGLLGRWWGGPVKVGAEGILAVARHGVGIAAKSLSGNGSVAAAAVLAAADRLGMLSPAQQAGLAEVAEPPVLGGGVRVGSLVLD